MKAAVLAAVFLLAYGAIGNMDVADAIDTEARVKEAQPKAAARRPGDAPRCPKLNARGEWLRLEVASRHDRTDWTHACYYHGVES